MAAGGRHAKAEKVHTADRVEGQETEGGASEGARAHGGSLGGLSGADHQMRAGDRAGQGVVGVQTSGEGATADLLEFRIRILS